MGLAFHQTDCVHYKVICIRSLESDDEQLFQIQIYSSDTGEWRICPVTFHTDCPVFDMGVYWNGAIHWAPSDLNHFYFKIDSKQLQTLPLPVEMTIFQTVTMYFGESRGHLHLTVLVDSDETGLHLNVYEMLSDHSGWFVKYQLQLHEIWGAFPEMTHSTYDFDVVDVVRGEKEEDTFIVLRIHGKLTRYNVHGKRFKQMCYFTDKASRKAAILSHSAAIHMNIVFHVGRCRQSGVHENTYLSEFNHYFAPPSNNLVGINNTQIEVHLIGINVVVGRQVELCDYISNSVGHSCVASKFAFINECGVMQKYMKCKGSCLASIGADQPAEVAEDVGEFQKPDDQRDVYSLSDQIISVVLPNNSIGYNSNFEN